MTMVMGIPRYLHLLAHEHPEEHNAEHCLVCQQLLIMPGKFIMEPELNLPDFVPQKNNVEFDFQSCIITFHSEPFRPRPPPLLEKS